MYCMECFCTHLLIPPVMAYCWYDDDMIFSNFCSCIYISFFRHQQPAAQKWYTIPLSLTKRTINSPWSTKNDTNFISIVLFCISRWLLGCVALLWGEEDKDVRERDRFSIEPLPLSSTDCLDVLFFPRIISGERWHSSKHEDAVEVDYSHLTKVEK